VYLYFNLLRPLVHPLLRSLLYLRIYGVNIVVFSLITSYSSTNPVLHSHYYMHSSYSEIHIAEIALRTPYKIITILDGVIIILIL